MTKKMNDILDRLRQSRDFHTENLPQMMTQVIKMQRDMQEAATWIEQMEKVIKSCRRHLHECATIAAREILTLRDRLLKFVEAVKKIRRSDLPDREQPMWDELQAALKATMGD